MKFSIKGALVSASLLAASTLFSASTQALNVSVSGFIRQEMAYKLNNDENPMNHHGSPLNGKTVPNSALTNPGSVALLDVLTNGAASGGFLPASFTKQDEGNENDWNVFATKTEIDFSIDISNNLSGFVKLRGYYQPDVFEEFGDNDGFRVDNHGNEATVLSFSDDDYMIDFPSLYLDYQRGPLWLRVGQQQIAWGEGLFFRVADVANGLDLRRHLFLDFGAEEYSDERMSAPGVRASYVINNEWEIEAFVQMFQPSVLPVRGSPYNLVGYAFTPNYQEGFDKVDDNWNAGFRLRGQLGDLGLQFFAVSRHNPDPIFTWAPGGQSLANVFNGPLGASGQTFASQPFVQEPTYAVDSAVEWFAIAGLSGLDGVAALNRLVDDYGFTQDAFLLFSAFGLTNGVGDPSISTVDQAYPILDTFFTGLGPLGAELEATYAYENVFGFGFNYIFYAEPDTLMDQLVVRFEASYTPDKKFTDPGLSINHLEKDEWVTSLVFEKYHRFSNEFPATFVVFEWMHKSQSDMLGRHLSGLGGDATHRPGGGEDDRGWDGLVFAFQQPFPNLIWRADLSVLYDLNGGLFVQPAVRYKPSGTWAIEAFANFIDSKDNASIFAGSDWSDDVTLRVTYQF
ncbi:MAG: DUF1302 family protein [Porticoccaceae bacterium]